MTARRGRIAADPIGAAGDLIETLGPDGAQKWVREVADELRAAFVPTELIISLACISAYLEDDNEADAGVIDQAVAILMGRP